MVAVGKLTDLQKASFALVTGFLVVAVIFLAFLFGSYFKSLPHSPPLSASRKEIDNYKELRQTAKDDLKDNLEQIGAIFTPVFTALLGGLWGGTRKSGTAEKNSRVKKKVKRKPPLGLFPRGGFCR